MMNCRSWLKEELLKKGIQCQKPGLPAKVLSKGNYPSIKVLQSSFHCDATSAEIALGS